MNDEEIKEFAIGYAEVVLHLERLRRATDREKTREAVEMLNGNIERFLTCFPREDYQQRFREIYRQIDTFSGEALEEQQRIGQK
jgi:hypothetical protein